MFSRLIASERGGGGWRRNWWGIGVSILVHVLLFGGIAWAASAGAGGDAAEEDPEPEEVTYVDVTQIPEPPDMPEPEPAPEQEPPPRQEQPAPQRQQAPAPAPRQPRDAPEEPTVPDEPAGFQELQAPEELSGIPEPGAQEPVNPEDFGGRGTPGGRAGGEPPEQPAGTGGQGEGTGEGAPGGTPGGTGDGTYVSATVDRQPQLTNRAEIARMLQRLYPQRLRDMGIEGQVMVQFVIDANGRVEMGSVRIMSSSNDAFVGPTRDVLDDMRFQPARVGGRNVRMLTQMPIRWTVAR